MFGVPAMSTPPSDVYGPANGCVAVAAVMSFGFVLDGRECGHEGNEMRDDEDTSLFALSAQALRMCPFGVLRRAPSAYAGGGSLSVVVAAQEAPNRQHEPQIQHHGADDE